MRLWTPFFLLTVPASLIAQDLPHFSDAALRTIQFADENEGWAAGDDGVMWHTIDGGKTWERQPTGTRAALRSVHFLTPYSGWAVGRVELPGGGSLGVVLATTDGGLQWRTVSANNVTGLNVVKFFDDRIGIAAGDGSDSFPAGLFRTIDGGRSWKPVPGVRNPTWLAGDFSDSETGVVGGAWSRVAPIRDSHLGVADVDQLAGRSITGMKLNGMRAVAVGQGGLVMLSRDTAGVKWGFADLKIPVEVRAAIDFHAVAVHGSHIWAVGRPGSIVFHSADHGNSWEMLRTGQPLPLHAVYFHDEKHGWAAGEMGTMIGTVDGGKTWKVQHQGGMRSAVLFAHTNAKGVPLDTVAALGGNDGYLATAIGVTCSDPATLAKRYDTDAERIAAAMKAADPLRATDPMRVAAAMRLAGGAAGEIMWQFPIAGFQDGVDTQALLETWEKRHGEKAATTLLRQLVLALRIWRPEVVVTDGATDDTSKTLNLVVRKAFEIAADHEAFPEQLEVLDLEPWASRKLLSTLISGNMITAVNADVRNPLPNLGESAKDYAATAARLWEDVCDVPGFRLVATRLKDTDGQLRFFDGIALAPGGAARREQTVLSTKDEAARAEMMKVLEKKRNVQAVIDGHAGAIASPDQALSALGDAIRDLPAMDAGKALYTAATAYAKSGQWSMAREAYLLLLDKYPGHPLAVDAAHWLVRFQSSSEARRRFELGQFAELTETQITLKDRPDPRRVIPKAKNKDQLPPQTEIEQTTYRETLAGLVSARKWYEGALELENRLSAHGDLFARDVATNLCLASARRQLGKPEESQRWLMKYIAETTGPVGTPTGVRGADPWRDCVLLESWLLNRAGQPMPPKPVAACKKTTKRPFLDGKLDDECWAGAMPMSLITMAGELSSDFGCKEAIERELKDKGKPTAASLQEALGDGSRAMFAFDDEHLYIAIVCKHPAGMKRSKLETRSRDMDLRAFDRVSILIDLDRDYQTYYQLQVDQRGALAEDCWGDKTWNPKWFVAVNAEETGWTAEIAIPLSELTGDLVAPGKLWAVNVVRTVPGKGVQAWSGPAGVTPRPEGMGIMTFVGEAKK
ncbi:MAG TPA: YCF48-related protein [Gemmataceae bacterium]|nr:YCF48-related protein [Gemmataceae bacterium]